MNTFLRFVAIITCFVMLFAISGCGSKNVADAPVNTAKYSDMSFVSDEIDNGAFCENSMWRVEWDSIKKRVSFTDKVSGCIWGQSPAEGEDPVYDEDGMIIKNHPQAESALAVYYYDPISLDEVFATSEVDAVYGGNVFAEIIDNGIKVTYDFSELEITVPVEYTIEKDCFRITVRPEQISDNGVNYVTAIKLAPFMCGVKNESKDSWLFLPDGCGTIAKPTETDEVGNSGESKVFGDDLLVQTYDFTSVEKQANLPVFGVKKSDKALFCIVDQGMENASVAWNIGSKNIGYSGVCPFFRVRGYSYIEAPRGFWSPLSEIKVFADYISCEPLSVRYYSLSGEKADIFGMAETYRNYLCEDQGMKVSKADEGKLSIKYIGGVIQNDLVLGMPTTKLYPLTTLEQAANISEELSDLSKMDFYVNLVGFGKSGVDAGQLAGGFTVNGKLGGEKGIKSFSNEMKKLKTEWYMDFDLISFSKSGKGFSKVNDVAVLPNGQVAWFGSYDTVSRERNGDRYYLLARNKFADAVNKLIVAAKSFNLSGISLNSLSNTVYSDYSSASMSVSRGFPKDADSVFTTVNKNGFNLLTGASNSYAALKSYRETDAPIYSSGYDVSYTDIQFYGLVFKGYIPLNSVSINLCADENDAILRCIESGTVPGFTLTNNYDNELITSQHSFIYGTLYSGQKKKISDVTNELNEYYTAIKGAKVSGYKLLNENLRMTEFDNGVVVFVNYGNNASKTEYGSVAANSWIMKGGK